jgi:D-alanyl-D-alanine dipeptidase
VKPKDVNGKSRHGKNGKTDAVWLRRFVCLPVCCLCLSCAENPRQQDVPVCSTTQETSSKTTVELRLEKLGLLEIALHVPAAGVELKYASTDNFTKQILYGDLKRAYLHPYAAEKLAKAQMLLEDKRPGYSLLVYDAARPLAVQRKMYNAVKNTPCRAYVANPERTSLHNYGLAVDITIRNENCTPLDMGTPFDYFGAKAGINNEEGLLAAGLLTRMQIENRKLLRQVMQEAGFIPVRGEWWHFNACSLSEAKRIGQAIE